MPEFVDRFLRYCYAAVSSLYLFTFGVFSNRNRLLISRIAQHFGYHRAAEKPSLPALSIDELVPAQVEVRLRACNSEEGNMTLTELVSIAQLVSAAKPARLFEVGTFDGRTTLAMADNAAPGAIVFTLDLPASGIGGTALRIEDHERHLIDKPESGARFRALPDVRERIIQLWGDSAAYDYAPYVGTCDFVFIDGSHAYDYVMSDSETALRLLSDRGTIVWHDYGEWPGVTKALNRLHASDKRFSGLKAIAGTTLVTMRKGGAGR